VHKNFSQKTRKEEITLKTYIKMEDNIRMKFRGTAGKVWTGFM
jgi:hypothetical protein